MEILITNDDGIDAPGIEVLAEAAKKIKVDDGEELNITIVAPATEQSGQSHAVTLGREITVHRHGDAKMSIGGTPTDCVLLVMKRFLEVPLPDLVLSGVNHGANMGDDITYSGTVAAAIEATLFGVPAIAFSVAARGNLHFEGPDEIIPGIVRKMIDNPPAPKTFWNVNFPNVAANEIEGIRFTHLGKHTYHDSVVRKNTKDGEEAIVIGGGELDWEEDPLADFHTVFRDRHISITPIHLDMNDYKAIEAMRLWNWEDFRR